jgi:DNA-binding transcriptional regulator GbsR (MarR family)
VKGSKPKNIKTYLTHFPVESYLEADILSKEIAWKIMDDIRQTGAKGITAEDIIEKENLPASIVYSVLKELYRLEFIFLYPRNKKNRGDRKKRFVCEKGTWGKYGIDKEFDAALKMSGTLSSMTEELRQPILKIFKELLNEFNRTKEMKQFLPTQNTNICPNCQRSHEAMEFFYASLLRTIDLMITESDEFKKFLVERGYASDEL